MSRKRTSKKGKKIRNRNKIASRGNRYTLNRLRARKQRKVTRKKNYNNLPKHTRKQRGGGPLGDLKRKVSNVRADLKSRFGSGILIKINEDKAKNLLINENIRFYDNDKVSELFNDKTRMISGKTTEIDFSTGTPISVGSSTTGILYDKGYLLSLYPTDSPTDKDVVFKKSYDEQDGYDMSDENQKSCSRSYIFHRIIDGLKQNNEGESATDDEQAEESDISASDSLKQLIEYEILPHRDPKNKEKYTEKEKDDLENELKENKFDETKINNIISYIAGKLSKERKISKYKISKSRGLTQLSNDKFEITYDIINQTFVVVFEIKTKDKETAKNETKEIESGEEKDKIITRSIYDNATKYKNNIITLMQFLNKDYEGSRTKKRNKKMAGLSTSPEEPGELEKEEVMRKALIDGKQVEELFEQIYEADKVNKKKEEIDNFIDYVVNKKGLKRLYQVGLTVYSLSIDKTGVKYLKKIRNNPEEIIPLTALKSDPKYSKHRTNLKDFIDKKLKSVKDGEDAQFLFYKKLLSSIKPEPRPDFKKNTSTLILSAFNKDKKKKYIEIHDVGEGFTSLKEYLSGEKAEKADIPEKLQKLYSDFESIGIIPDLSNMSKIYINKDSRELKLVHFANCRVEEKKFKTLFNEPESLYNRGKELGIFIERDDFSKVSICSNFKKGKSSQAAAANPAPNPAPAAAANNAGANEGASTGSNKPSLNQDPARGSNPKTSGVNSGTSNRTNNPAGVGKNQGASNKRNNSTVVGENLGGESAPTPGNVGESSNGENKKANANAASASAIGNSNENTASGTTRNGTPIPNINKTKRELGESGIKELKLPDPTAEGPPPANEE